ncbi:MAG TPA: DoxX family protein [Flavobacteriaceae bacterium]|nr:DoxX family protein [Flavobacteriaceae bacterium]MCB9212615.1 DoxX family protein [Alteromonas sp.]HPF10684.1 DoxX family protein [Flavobacteriaceae bacterium]HQU21971.1 DoxX family protein [Flavobacteriaceae bacterium]HQU64325.1 DoxX family protein [Flavobacteriaceae bacterium]
MKRYEDFGLLLLRVGFSLLLLTHGYGKLMAFVGGNTALVGNPIGVGALISSILVLIGEVVAPVLILIGLKTRWAALASAITMGVAAFIAHSGDALAEKEKALLYFIGFLAIALMGAGKISVDKK